MAANDVAPTVAITGSSGLIGSNLRYRLRQAGQTVYRVLRERGGPGEASIYWRPAEDVIDRQAFEGVGAVVHLAGESLTAGRWTVQTRQRIMESRSQGTALLASALAGLQRPPQVLVSASAVGYYGDRGAEVLAEDSGPGQGFLAEVCQAWEGATQPAQEAGIRVVHLRFGVVLSASGGLIPRVLPPFKMGLGGILGDGRQYLSWIALPDLLSIIERALADSALSGPLNATSPNPVTNAEFTRALGRIIGRPTFMRLPAPILRLALGQMADEVLLASTRAVPRKLQELGFEFRYPSLEAALKQALTASNKPPGASA